jgi:hypothetical protein
MVIAWLPSILLSLVLSVVLTIVLNLGLNVILVPALLIGVVAFCAAMVLIRLLTPV